MNDTAHVISDFEMAAASVVVFGIAQRLFEVAIEIGLTN
jgi:hypothetical protein